MVWGLINILDYLASQQVCQEGPSHIYLLVSAKHTHTHYLLSIQLLSLTHTYTRYLIKNRSHMTPCYYICAFSMLSTKISTLYIHTIATLAIKNLLVIIYKTFIHICISSL